MKNALLLLVICLAFSACKQDKQPIDEPQKPTVNNSCYIQKSLIPYDVKTNSYWVYTNDLDPGIDSVSVQGSETGMMTLIPSTSKSTGYSGEYYKINLKSSYYIKTYNNFLKCNEIVINGSAEWGTWGKEGQPIYNVNSAVGTSSDGMEIISKLNTLNINGITFNNITKIKITAANQRLKVFDNDTYLYYVDTVGLIKKEIVLGLNLIQTWSIKRWKILK